MNEKQYVLTETDLQELCTMLLGESRRQDEVQIYTTFQGSQLNLDFKGFNYRFGEIEK
jgi:hypothetical protein